MEDGTETPAYQEDEEEDDEDGAGFPGGFGGATFVNGQQCSQQ